MNWDLSNFKSVATEFRNFEISTQIIVPNLDSLIKFQVIGYDHEHTSSKVL